MRGLLASLLGCIAVGVGGPFLACGGESPEEESACSLVGKPVVVDALRAAGSQRLAVARSASESLHQSVCSFTARGINVRVAIDTAPQVRRRYFVRVTEQELVDPQRPETRPRPISGLGDDDAYGPAGAYWVPAHRQLFALSGERLLIVGVSVDGIGAKKARLAAEKIADVVLETPPDRSAARASRRSPTAPLQLSIIAPAEGELVRSPRVTVRGTLAGRGATVRVAGRRAQVRQGIFARAVMLSRGKNVIQVLAAGERGERQRQLITVRRGRSATELAEVFARRHPGMVPDVIGERLSVAEAILEHLGLRYRRINLSPDPLAGRAWAVCLTRPAAGTRLGNARRVLLLIDRADIFRASGTACAQN